MTTETGKPEGSSLSDLVHARVHPLRGLELVAGAVRRRGRRAQRVARPPCQVIVNRDFGEVQ